MNEIPKIVLDDHAACRLARGPSRRGDLSEQIWRLKREPGKDRIVYGGSTSIKRSRGLVGRRVPADDPAGHARAGLPLFKDLTAPLHLELVEATTHASGVATHVYRPGTSAADQPVDPDEH